MPCGYVARLSRVEKEQHVKMHATYNEDSNIELDSGESSYEWSYDGRKNKKLAAGYREFDVISNQYQQCPDFWIR